MVRMDIREGARPEVRVIPVAELDRFGGEPIPAARATFRAGAGLSAEEAVLSDINGMVPTTVLVWGPPTLAKLGELELGFTCSKEGYHPISSTVSLGSFDFRMFPEVPDHTVLVLMVPNTKAVGPVADHADPPPD